MRRMSTGPLAAARTRKVEFTVCPGSGEQTVLPRELELGGRQSGLTAVFNATSIEPAAVEERSVSPSLLKSRARTWVDESEYCPFSGPIGFTVWKVPFPLPKANSSS